MTRTRVEISDALALLSVNLFSAHSYQNNISVFLVHELPVNLSNSFQMSFPLEKYILIVLDKVNYPFTTYVHQLIVSPNILTKATCLLYTKEKIYIPFIFFLLFSPYIAILKPGLLNKYKGDEWKNYFNFKV